MNIKHLTPIILLLISGSVTAANPQQTCTEQMAQQADIALDNLNSWSEVHSWHSRFEACDDGYFAEGISDSVGDLLANNWSKLTELNSLVLKNKDFESFVLKHIDSTLDQGVVAKIESNANSHCIATAKQLCKKIESSAKKAS